MTYSFTNKFRHKHNSCSWQPEHYIINRYTGLQQSFKETTLVSHEILHSKIVIIPYIILPEDNLDSLPTTETNYGKIISF